MKEIHYKIRLNMYIIASNNSTEPNNVYKKKKYAARIFLSRDPQTPIIRNIGIKRLIGLSTVLTVAPNIIQSGFQGLYNVTNEELQALKQYLPEWSKNSTLLPMRTEDGNFKYIDFSHANAYDTLLRPIQSLIRAIRARHQWLYLIPLFPWW